MTLSRIRVLAAFVLLAACAPPADEPPRVDTAVAPAPVPATPATAAPPRPPATPLQGEARLALTVDSADGGRVTLVGRTNLPDGTEILGSLSATADDATYQGKGVVSSGSVRIGPLGPSGGLPQGAYVADLTAPYSGVQPDSVQALIGGRRGEGLRGPLVSRNTALPDFGAAVTSRPVRHTVGGARGVAAAETQALRNHRDVAAARAVLPRLIAAGRAMEPLRRTEDLAALRTCGVQMRRYQAEVDSLRARFDQLPLALRVGAASPLLMAAPEVHRCVSCAEDAIAACREAATMLRDTQD